MTVSRTKDLSASGDEFVDLGIFVELIHGIYTAFHLLQERSVKHALELRRCNCYFSLCSISGLVMLKILDSFLRKVLS